MWNVSPFHPLLKGVACSLASLSDASQFWIWAISLKRIRHNIFKVKTNLIQNIYNYPRIFGVCFKNDIAQTKSAAITSWQKGYFVPATIESKRHPLLKEEQTPAQSWGWNKRDGRRWVEGSTDFNLGFQGWHPTNCILFGHRLEAVSKRFQKYRQNQIWSNLIKIIVLIKFIKFDQIWSNLHFWKSGITFAVHNGLDLFQNYFKQKSPFVYTISSPKGSTRSSSCHIVFPFVKGFNFWLVASMGPKKAMKTHPLPTGKGSKKPLSKGKGSADPPGRNSLKKAKAVKKGTLKKKHTG